MEAQVWCRRQISQPYFVFSNIWQAQQVRVKWWIPATSLRSTSWDPNWGCFLLKPSMFCIATIQPVLLNDVDFWLRAMPRNSIWHPEVPFCSGGSMDSGGLWSTFTQSCNEVLNAPQEYGLPVKAFEFTSTTHIISWTSLSTTGLQPQWIVLSCVNSGKAWQVDFRTHTLQPREPTQVPGTHAGLPNQRMKFRLFKASLPYLWEKRSTPLYRRHVSGAIHNTGRGYRAQHVVACGCVVFCDVFEGALSLIATNQLLNTILTRATRTA